MKKYALYVLPALLALLVMVAAATVLLRGQDPSVIETKTQIKAPDTGNIQGPAVVNFFASWCVPCEAEHSIITRLSDEVAVYGVNYMDTKEKAAAFFARLGNPYEEVVYDTEGQAGVEWGLVGVPTTFVLDENNMIIYRQDSPLVAADIEDKILPALEKSE